MPPVDVPAKRSMLLRKVGYLAAMLAMMRAGIWPRFRRLNTRVCGWGGSLALPPDAAFEIAVVAFLFVVRAVVSVINKDRRGNCNSAVFVFND